MVGGWRRLELVVVLDFLLFVLVDVLYGTILWGITMKCRHFPTFFCAGTTKKKYVDVADRACRQNFADIVGCRRHVGNMLPTCATKIPNAMRRPQAVGIAYAVVGSLAWRGEMRGVKK